MNIQHRFAQVKAFYRANNDTVRIPASIARFGYNMGHCGVPANNEKNKPMCWAAKGRPGNKNRPSASVPEFENPGKAVWIGKKERIHSTRAVSECKILVVLDFSVKKSRRNLPKSA